MYKRSNSQTEFDFPMYSLFDDHPSIPFGLEHVHHPYQTHADHFNDLHGHDNHYMSNTASGYLQPYDYSLVSPSMIAPQMAPA